MNVDALIWLTCIVSVLGSAALLRLAYLLHKERKKWDEENEKTS